MNTYIQNIFYHFILSDSALAQKIEPDFFDAKPLQICFKCAKDFVIRYHQAPSSNQMKELISNDNLSETITNDIIDYLYASAGSVSDYPYDWLYDNVTTWASWKNFVASVSNTVAFIKLNQDDVTVENVKEKLERAKGAFNKSCILEFSNSDDNGSDFWNAGSHKQKKLVRSSAGYPFIDFCLNGGYFPGCLTCFVGAPKIGKSLWMQNLCAESVKKGENCCYISLELPEEMVTSRIGSNLFSIPSLEYNKYSDDEETFKEMMSNYRRHCLVPPGALDIKEFPTSAASVIDLESYLLSKEEELSTEDKPFKFKNVFVDYINIMKNYRNPNTENTYMKIKQIAEDLRAMGAKHKWSIITATQTNREQYGKNDIEASMVSESSALGATVDIMFGIIATPLMLVQGKYYLKCLYDRVSPQANKKKLFDCDFNHLRITEDLSEGILDVDMSASPQKFSNKIDTKSDNGPKFAGKDTVIQEEQKQEESPLLAQPAQVPNAPTSVITTSMFSLKNNNLFYGN